MRWVKNECSTHCSVGRIAHNFRFLVICSGLPFWEFFLMRWHYDQNINSECEQRKIHFEPHHHHYCCQNEIIRNGFFWGFFSLFSHCLLCRVGNVWWHFHASFPWLVGIYTRLDDTIFAYFYLFEQTIFRSNKVISACTRHKIIWVVNNNRNNVL